MSDTSYVVTTTGPRRRCRFDDHDPPTIVLRDVDHDLERVSKLTWRAGGRERAPKAPQRGCRIGAPPLGRAAHSRDGRTCREHPSGLFADRTSRKSILQRTPN